MAKGAYSFVTYPESSNHEDIADWFDFMGYEWSRSPLHDKDVNDDGTLKKAHYHWIVGLHKGFTTCKEWHKIFKENFPSATPFVEICRDIQGAFDYHTHKKNPEKAQYDESDILKSEYFNPEDFVTTEQKRLGRKQDKESNVTAILKMISEYQISEFFQIVDIVVAKYPELLGDLLQNTHFFTNYIKSLMFYKVKYSAIEQELAEVRQELETLHEEHADLLESYVHVYEVARFELEQKGEYVPDAWTKPI
jgi:hypothetical protein